jgi:TPR repeat protein
MAAGRFADKEPIYHTTVRRLTEAELREKLSGPPEEAARWVYAAPVTLGRMLLDGHGMNADPEAAFRWFRIAADAGDLDGINMLGRCYELGWGVPVDLAQARACYGRAAAKDHDWAQFNLGTLMLRMDDSRVSVEGALRLFVPSARRGNPKSMNMIGRYREFGWAGPVNIPSAIRWYRRAAVRGCFRGASHLARFMREQGRLDEAVRWYRQSAETAPFDFCRDLASHLFEAQEPQLHEIARLALKRAAVSDEPADLFAYGHALAFGKGGEADLKEAAVWLARAETKGLPGALAVIEDARRQRG